MTLILDKETDMNTDQEAPVMGENLKRTNAQREIDAQMKASRWNPETGLRNGVTYIRDADGEINWFKMLKPEHLYKTKEGKTAITLQGLRYLAGLRGALSVKQHVDSITYDPAYQLTMAATNTCTIVWRGNEDTDMIDEEFSDCAGATFKSVDPFVSRYIETIAANRAYCRAIRGYLNIREVSKDELGPDVDDPNAAPERVLPLSSPLVADSTTTQPLGAADGLKALTTEPPQSESPKGAQPKVVLEQIMKGMKLDFARFKALVIKRFPGQIVNSKPEDWQSIDDIPNNDIFDLISLVNEAKKQADEAKAKGK